jgi:hypothetical protein
MKQQQILIIGSVLAILLSVFIIYRSISVKAHFENSVSESLKTTEGYDQRFIDMVNRLEDILATRAKFGYSGGKDPMTGTTRKVVNPAPVVAKANRQPSKASATTTPSAAPVVAQAVDPVKLTAIIADASGKKITAVVMDGERSYSVDPGDVIAGRKITRITNDGIYMQSDTAMYFYDIYGNVVKKSRESGVAVEAPKEESDAPVQPKKPELPPVNKQHKTQKQPKNGK